MPTGKPVPCGDYLVTTSCVNKPVQNERQRVPVFDLLPKRANTRSQPRSRLVAVLFVFIIGLDMWGCERLSSAASFLVVLVTGIIVLAALFKDAFWPKP